VALGGGGDAPHQMFNQSIKDYFPVRPKVDRRAGRLCLPHVGITETQQIQLKHKNQWEFQ